MKIRNLLICLVAVAVFSVPAVAQTGDTACDPIPAVPDPGGKSFATASVDPCLDGDPTGPMDPMYHYSTGVLDSWMTFVATDTTMRLRNDLFSTSTDSEMTVYSGDDCGSLTPIAWPAYECYFNYSYGWDDGPNPCATGKGPWYSSVCLSDLTVGATYWVKVGIYNDGCPDDEGDPPNNTSAPVLVSVGTGDACGDGWLSCTVDPAEQCDIGNGGRDEMACDRGCEAGDTCLCLGRLSAPMLPSWGLAGLGLLLLAGGAMVFGRRRAATA